MWMKMIFTILVDTSFNQRQSSKSLHLCADDDDLRKLDGLSSHGLEHVLQLVYDGDELLHSWQTETASSLWRLRKYSTTEKKQYYKMLKVVRQRLLRAGHETSAVHPLTRAGRAVDRVSKVTDCTVHVASCEHAKKCAIVPACNDLCTRYHTSAGSAVCFLGAGGTAPLICSKCDRTCNDHEVTSR